MGDPAGIGPEVVVKAATVPDIRAGAKLVVFGDPTVLSRAVDEAGVRLDLVEVDDVKAAVELGDHQLGVRSISRLQDDEAFGWGTPTERSDAAQFEYIRGAYEAVAAGDAEAIVTAPISKASLKRAGMTWPGHTEMLADWCGVDGPLMMLAGPTLKVVPLTVHVPLASVPSMITPSRVEHAIRITDETFRKYFFRRKPRIVVAGLNPHAGEQGMFGGEDAEVLVPTVERCKQDGIDVYGPYAADTVYRRAVAGEFDVVIGMYHDQALIPLKLLDFDQAVNVTLGLPIIRTSVDHGTAYDIAGKGVASAGSMMAALSLARDMAERRR